ncbi:MULTISPECIES: hypothetical protein [Neomoorella]|uniref:Uncharacterized protein n=2 Tax=Neomoorella TaxID=44260 RepID=A0A151AWC0_9FIRM|nr:MULTISPECIES: hypothetical protein [Moorella]KYH31964.1 hypothetical protein MOMUL_18460 [Moorella mulderi DSM 14980]QGP91247.1 hypothetical protein MGLY_05740 [Moorella glycerini]
MLPVRIFAVLPFLVALFFAVTGLFQWLWNITMPEVFNLKRITFWQALRLLLIAGILFGGAHFTWR